MIRVGNGAESGTEYPAFHQVRSRAHAPRRIGLNPPSDRSLILLTILVFAVAGGMLWMVGINYDGLTGSAASKIHPATYFAVILFAWSLAHAGNPVANLVTAIERRPASLLLGILGVALAVQISVRGGAGIAGAIDTFLLPALVCLLFVDADDQTLRRIETTVHVLMTVNALLGIFEFVTRIQVFPYRLDGALLYNETRSMALQGHPLPNAALTACYILALGAGGGALGPIQRLMMIGLQLVALVTFGGRSGIVVTLGLGGVLGAIGFARALARGRIPLLAVAGVAFALPAFVLVVGGLAGFGFFDFLLGRFENDGGSANSRLVVLELFTQLPLRDLFIGPDPNLVDTMRRMNGLALGLENPIVRIALYQGALMTGLLVVAFALFLFEVGRRCRPGIAMPMIAFVLLVNTYESLGVKTTLLAKFVILLLALHRPQTEPSPLVHPDERW